MLICSPTNQNILPVFLQQTDRVLRSHAGRSISTSQMRQWKLPGPKHVLQLFIVSTVKPGTQYGAEVLEIRFAFIYASLEFV